MSQDIVLGIDIGTSACKAVAINSEGEIQALSYAPYNPISLRPGWFELNPNAIIDAFITVVHNILEKVPREHIKGIGIDGISNSPILIDKSFKFLKPFILWMDQRGSEYVPAIYKALEMEGITPPLPITPLLTLVKLLWIRNNEPELWKNTYYVLQPKDYVRMWLTNSVATDQSDASVTMMFDGNTFKWSDYIENLFGIELRKLPEVIFSHNVAGHLTKKAAEKTGLQEGIPVITGCADGVADTLAAGLTKEFDCLIRLGTAGAFSMILNKYIPNKERYYVFAHAVPNQWVIQRMFPFGVPHKWFLNTFYNEELERARSAGLDPYTYIESILSFIDIKDIDDLIFVPNIRPFEDPSHFFAAFIGVKSVYTKSHFALALLQGLVCAIKEALEIVSEGLGFTMNKIRLVGGGSKSALMRKMIAALLDTKIETVRYHEASIGAAILAGIGIRIHKSFEEFFEKIVKVDYTVEPDKHLQSHLLKIYQKYREVRNMLR